MLSDTASSADIIEAFSKSSARASRDVYEYYTPLDVPALQRFYHCLPAASEEARQASIVAMIECRATNTALSKAQEYKRLHDRFDSSPSDEKERAIRYHSLGEPIPGSASSQLIKQEIKSRFIEDATGVRLSTKGQQMQTLSLIRPVTDKLYIGGPENTPGVRCPADWCASFPWGIQPTVHELWEASKACSRPETDFQRRFLERFTNTTLDVCLSSWDERVRGAVDYGRANAEAAEYGRGAMTGATSRPSTGEQGGAEDPLISDEEMSRIIANLNKNRE